MKTGKTVCLFVYFKFVELFASLHNTERVVWIWIASGNEEQNLRMQNKIGFCGRKEGKILFILK